MAHQEHEQVEEKPEPRVDRRDLAGLVPEQTWGRPGPDPVGWSGQQKSGRHPQPPPGPRSRRLRHAAQPPGGAGVPASSACAGARDRL